MKRYPYLVLILLVAACTNNEKEDSDEKEAEEVETASLFITDTSFQEILDSNYVNGGILIYDPQANEYYTNSLERSTLMGFLPASTFKITNSIIGLETGELNGLDHMFKWDGKPRRLPQWEADLNLKQAFHRSCVPCYQELARKIGFERMRHYLDTFEYGDMNFTGDEIDKFWLEGESRITPLQQIDFLVKVYKKELPVSERTSNLIKELMIIDTTDQYILSGKTGWSLREDFNLGWFVGYLEIQDKVFYVVSAIEPQPEFNMDNFISMRLDVALEALKKRQIIR